MIAVACVWVKANVPYGVEYVARLRAMVAKHLTQPHRFVCLTDRPAAVPDGVEAVRIASPHPLPGWWAKIELFSPARQWGSRVLYLDLDTLVVRGLDELVASPAPFTLIPEGGSTFQGRHGLAVVKRFNSSVMVFDPAAVGQVWDTFSAAVPRRLWGDQDHIGEQCPSAATWPLEWFPRLSSIGAGGVVPAEARVILSKKPKNTEAAAQWPWFDALWRAA